MSTKKPTTIVLANRPRLLRELLRFALVGSGDSFQVVVVDNEGDLAATLRKVAPDWVVVTSQPKVDNDVQSAWLTISQDGSKLRALLPAHLAAESNNIEAGNVEASDVEAGDVEEGEDQMASTFTDISLNDLLNLFRSTHRSAGRAAA